MNIECWVPQILSVISLWFGRIGRTVVCLSSIQNCFLLHQLRSIWAKILKQGKPPKSGPKYPESAIIPSTMCTQFSLFTKTGREKKMVQLSKSQWAFGRKHEVEHRLSRLSLREGDLDTGQHGRQGEHDLCNTDTSQGPSAKTRPQQQLRKKRGADSPWVPRAHYLWAPLAGSESF